MVQDRLWKQILKSDGEPVLSLSLRTPELAAEGRGPERISRYYSKLTDIWKARWEHTLFPAACASLAAAREVSRPFQPWSAALDYRVTLEDDRLLSICVDATERCDGRPMTVRTADTWEIQSGFPHLLPDFLPKSPLWRRPLLAELTSQTQTRLQSGESFFHPDAARRLRRSFSSRRFYLTDRHVAIFFPMLSLAAAAEGIPVFLLPRPSREEDQNSQPV